MRNLDFEVHLFLSNLAGRAGIRIIFTDVTQQVRSDDGELPSWEGAGGGCGRGDAAKITTHPLPLPEGELPITLRNMSY